MHVEVQVSCSTMYDLNTDNTVNNLKMHARIHLIYYNSTARKVEPIFNSRIPATATVLYNLRILLIMDVEGCKAVVNQLFRARGLHAGALFLCCHFSMHPSCSVGTAAHCPASGQEKLISLSLTPPLSP